MSEQNIQHTELLCSDKAKINRDQQRHPEIQNIIKLQDSKWQQNEQNTTSFVSHDVIQECDNNQNGTETDNVHRKQEPEKDNVYRKQEPEKDNVHRKQEPETDNVYRKHEPEKDSVHRKQEPDIDYVHRKQEPEHCHVKQGGATQQNISNHPTTAEHRQGTANSYTVHE